MATRNVAVLDSDIEAYSNDASPGFNSAGAGTRFRETRFPPSLPSLPQQLCRSNEPDHYPHDDYRIALFPNNRTLPNGSVLEVAATPNPVLILPFTWRELLDRIRRDLNPAISEAHSLIARFGEVRVDFQTMEISRSQRPVVLTHQEFKLLRFFVHNPQRVLCRDELLNEVWGYNNYPSTRTVDNHVWMLRRKLELNPARPVHFLTVQRMGYKFVPHKGE